MTEPSTDSTQIDVRIEIAGKRVVDVGCGGGAMVRFMRSRGADPVGVECGEAMLNEAVAADPAHQDAYLEGVAQNLPLPDRAFDLACFFRSLHHVPVERMDAALREAWRVLVPGGIVYVVEPVAAGPAFEVAKLVDDETEVRRLAQECLARASSTIFEVVDSGVYTTRSVYGDFEDWKQHMVGVDPGRVSAIIERGAEAEQAFLAQGTRTGRGWAFDQQQAVLVLLKKQPPGGPEALDPSHG